MAKRGGRQPGAGRPCIYPWKTCEVGGSFVVSVGPGDTGEVVQKRLCRRVAERRQLYGERWKTKQLYKAVKVTRIA